MTEKEALQRAIEIVGGQSALARAIGVKQSTLWYWLQKTGRAQAEYVAAIVDATGGQVTRNHLRPDLWSEADAAADAAE